MLVKSLVSDTLAGILSKGGVGVLPTDTLYGLVAVALSKKAVMRVYRLRKRAPEKPCIVLIGSLEDLRLLSIKPSERIVGLLKKMWPGSVSIILPCVSKKLSFLHRGTNTLAVRLPKKRALRSLLSRVGPLIAPSANPEGKKPAETLKEAREYFCDRVDFYVNGGTQKGKPSTLVSVKNDRLRVIRQGSSKIKPAIHDLH